MESTHTIKIVKGHELNIHVSNDICYDDSIMNSAFRQATNTLVEVVRQTRNFHNS